MTTLVGVRRGILSGASTIGGGGPGIPDPQFWIPFSDAGAGAVNTGATNAVSGTPTFTRATTAYTKLSSGLWASVATGVARSCYLGNDTTVGAYAGYFSEVAATNLCLQSRDLSNASWTKVSTTGAKDQTGIDGSANSASSLTATGAGGTCLQTITEAATASALSMFIKRITGTGTITIQQGASTLDVTALINSSTYTRVELDATVLNPAIGIVITTSGDKIAVDMVQFENTGAKASSPIPTTTVAVTRNSDLLSYLISNANSAIGTSYAEVSHPTGTLIAGNPIILSNTNNGMRALGVLTASGFGFCNDSANLATCSANDLRTGTHKMASSWSTITGLAVYSDGANKGTNATFGGNMFNGAAISVGDGNGGTFWNGFIKNVKIWAILLSDGQIASL